MVLEPWSESGVDDGQERRRACRSWHVESMLDLGQQYLRLGRTMRSVRLRIMVESWWQQALVFDKGSVGVLRDY